MYTEIFKSISCFSHITNLWCLHTSGQNFRWDISIVIAFVYRILNSMGKLKSSEVEDSLCSNSVYWIGSWRSRDDVNTWKEIWVSNVSVDIVDRKVTKNSSVHKQIQRLSFKKEQFSGAKFSFFLSLRKAKISNKWILTRTSKYPVKKSLRNL